MIEEAIAKIEEMATLSGEVRVVNLWDTPEDRTVLVSSNGTSERLVFPKEKPCRNHTFYTLESFVSYLHSVHCAEGENGNVVVFVGRDKVLADLNYGGHRSESAVLSFTKTTEYRALEKLSCWAFQHDFVQLLRTHLWGCISKALLMQLGAIRISRNSEQTVRVDNLGMASGEGKSAVSVTFAPGPNEAPKAVDILIDWEYEGRAWNLWDRKVIVPLRLSADVDDKNTVKFCLTPLGLDSILDQHRLELVAELKESLPKHILVFEGEPR